MSHAGHRGSQKVRLHSHIPEQSPSPTFLLLTIFRGLAGVTFLCFGELFWMHLSRIGLEHEGKLLGSIALILGAAMAVAALCGAAGLSVRDGILIPNYTALEPYLYSCIRGMRTLRVVLLYIMGVSHHTSTILRRVPQTTVHFVLRFW